MTYSILYVGGFTYTVLCACLLFLEMFYYNRKYKTSIWRKVANSKHILLELKFIISYKIELEYIYISLSLKEILKEFCGLLLGDNI